MYIGRIIRGACPRRTATSRDGGASSRGRSSRTKVYHHWKYFKLMHMYILTHAKVEQKAQLPQR